MLTKTSFLAGFSTLLCGRSKRKKQAVLVEQQKGICERSPDGLSKQLNSKISPELLSSQSVTTQVVWGQMICSGIIGEPATADLRAVKMLCPFLRKVDT